MAKAYGASNDRLTDVSEPYIHETQALEAGILDLLKKYDRAALTPDQQLTADIYTWWLDDRLRGQAFMYADYPVNPSVLSIHFALTQFFTDFRPVTNRQDVEDYNCVSFPR